MDERERRDPGSDAAAAASGLGPPALGGAAVGVALAAVEAPTQALLAACAAAASAEAAADGDKRFDAAPLLSRLEALIAALQSARCALAGHGELHAGGSVAGFDALPYALVLRILASLPVDARARCSAVCRDWRALLLQPGAWLHLDLSPAAGVGKRVDEWLLRRASGRARGQLRSLKLDGAPIPPEALLEVFTANSASLRDVSLRGMCVCRLDMRRWLRAAPALRSLHVSMEGTAVELVQPDLLRSAAPAGPLRLAGLQMGPQSTPAEVAAALRAHPGVKGVKIMSIALRAAESAPALDALLAGRAASVRFNDCALDAASVAPLARLIRCSKRLQHLYVCNAQHGLEPFLNAEGGAALAAALAANTTLRTLHLSVCFWRNGQAAAAVLQAAIGHPSLEALVLPSSHFDALANPAETGAQLAAVIAANSPALTRLDISLVALTDVGMAALTDALPRNTHLRELHCARVGMSDEFANDRFLPAIRDNASLRLLETGSAWLPAFSPLRTALRRAEAAVAMRTGADPAAA